MIRRARSGQRAVAVDHPLSTSETRHLAGALAMRRHRLLSAVQAVAGLLILSALAWAWHAETHLAPTAVPRPPLHASVVPLAIPTSYTELNVAITVDDRAGRAYVTVASIPPPTATTTPVAGGTDDADVGPTIDNRLYLVDTHAGRVLRGLPLPGMYSSGVVVAPPSGLVYMTGVDARGVRTPSGQRGATLSDYSGFPGVSVWRIGGWAFTASTANPAESTPYAAPAALARRLQGTPPLPHLPVYKQFPLSRPFRSGRSSARGVRGRARC